MSGRDPRTPDWVVARANVAREVLRDLVNLIGRQTSHLAPQPMPLNKYPAGNLG